ncbi:helix-turn-helix domain-containing protein [Nisaea sp.]|uniref:TetR/AcrR family transcriptional regulator n=1 Tax=Nisaea sp. TaxID=2024842 RepID=UPI0032995078
MSESPKPRRGRPPLTDRPETRGRILDAALEVFSERGYDGATVRQIAAKVGVSDPALYAHFKGKQEIFEALLKLAGPDLLASAGTSLASDKTPMQIAIPEMFGNIVATWSTPRAKAFASLVLRMGPDGLGNMLQDVSARLRPAFTVWQARGELRKDIPVDVAIWQVIGPLAGLRIAYLHGNASKADVAHAKSLAKTHLKIVAQTLTQTRSQEE